MAEDIPLTTEPDVSPRTAIVVLLVGVLLTFWPVCGFEFTSWDDEPFIARQPLFANPTLESIGYYWTHPLETIYVPVTTTAWVLLAMAGHSDVPTADGLTINPYLFHAANLLAHGLAAIAVFAVLRRLVKSNAALAGAMIWALHPVQVETVAWVSGLKDVLAGGLSFAAIALYLAAIDAAGMRRRLLYGGGIAVLIAAMLAKPSAMTTAGLIIAIDWLLLRRPIKTVAMWAGPWVGLAIGCAVLARLMQPVVIASTTPLWARPLIAGHSLAFYLKQVAWPAKLGLDYGQNPPALMASRWLYAAWLLPAALAVMAIVWRRHRWPLAAMAVFVVGAGHTLGLVGFDFQRISTTSDHYLYVPMLGVAMLAAWAFTCVPRRAAIGVAGAVVIALAVRSFVQVQTWRDSDTLFAHGLTVNDGSWAIRNSIATAAFQRQDLETAERESRRAIELNPAYDRPYLTLGAVLATRGDWPAATAVFRRAAEVSPTPDVLAQLGGILAAQGQVDEAERVLNQAISMNPNHPQALLNLAVLKRDRRRPGG